MRIAVFVSGTGRSLLNLIEKGFEIEFVCANKQCPALDIAKKYQIPTKVFSKEVLSSELDLIILAGFTAKIHVTPELTNKIINIHPSLLPAFGGKGMYGMNVHEAVIESGVKFTGCTVHYVNNEYDKGPIILQRIVSIVNDTPETLAAKVFEEEKIALPEAINIHFRNVY